MRKLLLCLAILPLLTGAAVAAETLNNAQMDRISAGELPGGTDLVSLVFLNWPPAVLGGTGTSICNAAAGCNGPAFMPTSPQAIFNDLGNFLLQAGYPSQ